MAAEEGDVSTLTKEKAAATKAYLECKYNNLRQFSERKRDRCVLGRVVAWGNAYRYRPARHKGRGV